MKRICNAANTIVPAFLVIRQRGFAVRKEDSRDREETWYAEKEGIQLIAEDPVTLLGLVAMSEARGEDWLADDEEIAAFMNSFGIEG